MRTRGRLRWVDPDFSRPVWVIEAEPNVMMTLKRIFPRLAPNRTGQVTIVDTPEVARDLAWALQRFPMKMSKADRGRLESGEQKHRDNEQLVQRILAGRTQPLPFQKPAVEPWPEQTQAEQLLLATKRYMLGDEVGLGKTFAALLPCRDPATLPALVVCPPHLQRQWLRELNEKLPWLKGHIIRRSAVYDPSEHREMRGHTPDVLIITYTKLHGWADHLAGQIKYVIFEEAQELRRGDTTKKYIAAAQIADAAEYKLEVTASPVYNYGGEAHTVISVMDQDALGTREEFVREWGSGERGDKTTVKDPAALGRYLREEGLLLRRKRKKGPPVRVPHLVDADEAEIERLQDDAEQLAELILAKATEPKVRFRAAGDLDWKVRRATGVAKAPYVATFVKMLLESEDKLVLWGWHRDVYAIWLDQLAEFTPVLYTGTESPAQKDRSVARFLGGDRWRDYLESQRGRTEVNTTMKEQGWDAYRDLLEESRLFIMSLRSGAGLDGLQKVCNVGVFGELDWSPAMHDQCLGRIDPTRGLAPGEDATEAGSALGYFLYTDHGSDPLVLETLNIKRGQAEPLIDPDQQLFGEPTDAGDRVKRLATEVLRKRRGGRQEEAA